MIYLDNCSTTKTCQESIDIMTKALSEDFANPSSLHSFGLKVEKEIAQSRSAVAKLVGAQASEIFFTSGGTESNNIAIHGLIKKNKRKGNKIITTAIEHASINDQFINYKNEGLDVKFIGVDKHGNVDIEKLLDEIDENTIVLSLIHVHNELGTINDLKEITKRVKEKNRNVLIHGDGVQAVGKIHVNLKDLGIDTYSISSHKIYGPKGAGALYVRESLDIPSLVIGGGQEKGLRSGTENVPGILGFAKACQLAYENLEQRIDHAGKIKAYLLKLLEEKLSDYQINTPQNSSNFHLSVSIKDIRAEVLLHYLEGDEIYISTASACSSNGNHKSKTLKEIGLNDNLMDGTIRICTSKDISFKDIDIFVEKLIKYVNEIRNIMIG